MCIILLILITNLWKDLRERVRIAKQFAHHHPPGMWRGWYLNPGSPTILNHYKCYFKINKGGTSRAGSYSLCPAARGTGNRDVLYSWAGCGLYKRIWTLLTKLWASARRGREQDSEGMETSRLGGDASPACPAISLGNVRIEDFKVVHHFHFSLSLFSHSSLF